MDRDANLLRCQLQQLMSKATENTQKMLRFQQLELKLISAQTLLELMHVVLFDYHQMFKLDAISLVLSDPNDEIRMLLELNGDLTQNHSHIIFITSKESKQALVEISLFPWLGAFRRRKHEWIFPHSFPKPNTVAILPLVGHGKLLGSINLGSFSKDRFSQSLNADFLERLAAVASVCFENTLNYEWLKRAGVTDSLTGINNRRFFDQRLHEESAKARRGSTPLSCLFLDIDRFKSINDRFGHKIGDLILREVSQMMSLQMRTSDVLARYGGEEFAVLLSNTVTEEAIFIAERIRHAIAFAPIRIGQELSVSVSISVGVATIHPSLGVESQENLGDKLLSYADSALLEAKASGRNRVVASATEIREKITARVSY